jgi:Leucine-rich repeat (LRR) protein
VIYGTQISDSPSTYTLDLGGCSKLEYLQLAASGLTAVPTLLRVPKTLRYLNLSSNKIASLGTDRAALAGLSKVPHVFLDFNEIPASQTKPFPNLTVEGIFDLLPQELQYTY